MHFSSGLFLVSTLAVSTMALPSAYKIERDVDLAKMYKDIEHGVLHPLPMYARDAPVDPNAGAGLTDADISQVSCKAPTDCPCPPGGSSTSCINGKCSCNNSAINAVGDIAMKSITAIGNAPVTKAMSQMFKTLTDIKEVAPTLAGLVLGPEAKAALQGALLAMPDVGPGHIDDVKNASLDWLKQNP